jgi:hypothetical protein
MRRGRWAMAVLFQQLDLPDLLQVKCTNRK